MGNRFDTINLSALSNTIGSNVNFDSNTLFIDGTNNRIGIGTNAPSTSLQIRETAAPTGLSSTTLRLSCDNYGVDIAGFLNQGTSHGVIISTVDNGVATERMRIDSSGRVSMPYQPAFTGDNTSRAAGNHGTVTGFTNRFNNGSHFNTSTGKFTAPIAGIYSFFGRIQAGFSTGYVYWDFRRNGTSVVSEFHTNMSSLGQWHDCVGTVIINMSANDTMEMFVRDNNSGYGMATFSGHMIG